jgi:hypothetical protein
LHCKWQVEPNLKCHLANAASASAAAAGTYAYVTAGHVGKAVLTEGEGSFGVESWQVAVALGATILALGFVGRLAKSAVEEADREALEEQKQEEQKQQQSKQLKKQQATAAEAAAGGEAEAVSAVTGEGGSS